MNERKVTRREFVRNGAALAAASAALAAAMTPAASAALFKRSAKDSEKTKTLNYNPRMQYRRLGKTGFWVSAVSFGGHWKNRTGGRYWDAFPNDEVPDDALKNREGRFAKACELGMNYLDITTPAEALVYGQVMKNLKIKMYVGYSDYLLCMRAKQQRTIAALMKEIDEGLRRLQVDCVDIFREQADTGGNHTDDEIKILVETFQKAHEQGKVKYLGMSSHSRPFLMHVIEIFPEFSMVIFPFPFGAKLDPKNSIFTLAAQKDVGVACVKPFNGGSLFRMGDKPKAIQDLSSDQIAALALRSAIEVKEMTCILPSMSEDSEVVNAARCAIAGPLNKEERELRDLLAPQATAMLSPGYAWLRDWQVV